MKTAFRMQGNRWGSSAFDRLPGHDLVFGSPVCDPAGGLPIGDGDLATLLWTGEDCLRLHINKSDLWQDSSWDGEVFCAGFDQEEDLTSLRHGGELTIRFDRPVFDLFYQKDYEARLSLQDAAAGIRAETPFSQVDIRSFASSGAHTTVLACKAQFAEPCAPEITLSRFGSRNFWRWYEQIRDDPAVGLDGTHAFMDGGRLYLTQKLNAACFCIGAAIETDLPYQTERLHSHSCRLVLKKSCQQRFTLYYTIALGKNEEAARAACDECLNDAVSRGEAALYQEHIEDWRDFWERSFLAVPDDYLENIYYLSLYYLNSECRGAYPPHFTQGLWGFRHDFVPWNYYFFYNMQHMFGPLNAAGHGELAEGYFRMRRNGLEAAQRYAACVKGLKGAFYHDVTDRYGRGADYDSQNFTPGAQIAMAMWRHYRYTGDETFLRETALPVMRAAARIYLSLLKKGEDGLYHPQGTTAYEANPPTCDTITDLCMIRVLFGVLIGLPEEKEQETYQEILDHLPAFQTVPMGLEECSGGRLCFGIGAGDPAMGEGRVLAYGLSGQGIPQRRNYGDPANTKGGCGFPDVEMAPVYPSGLVGLAQSGTPLFEALLNQIGLHGSAQDSCMHWCMMPLYLARMGLAATLPEYLRAYISRWQVYPNGFDGDGPSGVRYAKEGGFCWVTPHEVDTGEKIELTAAPFRYFDFESTPIAAHAVSESLLQSYDGTLRVCPAVRAVDAVSFRLFAEGGFVVQAEMSPEGFVITVDSMRGEACLLCLPSHARALPLYLYRLDGAKAIEVPPVWRAVGNETLLDLTPILPRGGRTLLCSVPQEALEYETPVCKRKNQNRKKCGGAVLGSPVLFRKKEENGI